MTKISYDAQGIPRAQSASFRGAEVARGVREIQAPVRVENAQVRENDAQVRVTVTPGLAQMRENDAQGRKNDAPRRAGKVINTPFSGGKEKGREKETFPPAPPIEKKGSQKKQSPIFFEPGYSKPARARVRASKRRLPCTCSYADAGDAAREIIGNCFGNFSDLRLWAWYCRHFNRERIVDKAYEYASMCRQRELREAITAFQAWLSKEFKDAPKEGISPERSESRKRPLGGCAR